VLWSAPKPADEAVNDQRRTAERKGSLCDLHPQIVRGGVRSGIQFAASAARSLRSVHQQPTARRLGVLAACYDDGGFSGVTMDRPALQRLLADIAAGRVDTVVVYKIDRLTRSDITQAILDGRQPRGLTADKLTGALTSTAGLARAAHRARLCLSRSELKASPRSLAPRRPTSLAASPANLANRIRQHCGTGI
jgi:hypothetical protein